MGGVDKADQLVTYYAFSHCSKKWWKRIFFHMMEVSIVNAYIIHGLSSTKRITHLDFHVILAKQFIELVHTFTPHIPAPLPTKGMPLCLTGRNHFPEPAGGKLDCRVQQPRGLKTAATEYLVLISSVNNSNKSAPRRSSCCLLRRVAPGRNCTKLHAGTWMILSTVYWES